MAGWLSAACWLAFARPAACQVLVPGSGERVVKVGDDFEDPGWSYVFNNPKNSSELDGYKRLPDGYSANGRWFEGPMRGQPDVLKIIDTPEGGLEGSTRSLLMRSLYTGTPGSPSRRTQQDDFIVNVRRRLGGNVPVTWLPNVVVRVYLPPFDEWEPRTGNSFALRAGAFGERSEGLEEYWPGMFIYFRSKADRRNKADSAYFLLRAGRGGGDFKGPEITETGWWTLGMSFTADGQVHYFARPGVEDLRPEDRISSQYPYGYRCRKFETFFFNVVSGDNGRTWSTPWIIDDPSLYLARRPNVDAGARQRRGRR